LKEVKEEISKYVSGENKQLIDTANDEGDWAQVRYLGRPQPAETFGPPEIIV